MGTYTELVIKTRITTDDPKVKAVLNYLFNDCEDDSEPPAELPDHEFFKDRKWDLIGKCSSFYHIPTPLSYFKDGYLFSRSDLKNYEGTIELFIDWISPYTSGLPGIVLGWTCLEQHNPILIVKKGEDSSSDEGWKSDFEVEADDHVMTVHGHLTIEELENTIEYYKSRGYKHVYPGDQNSSLRLIKKGTING